MYVKAYVKRSKHDVGDAGAICEAVRHPGARDLLIRQRTMLVNALRANVAGFSAWPHKLARLIAIVMHENEGRVRGVPIHFTH